MLGEKTISFPVVFGTVLRRLRKEAGLSQETLGFEADLQRNYISLMELGRYQPTIESVFKLSNALKLPPAGWSPMWRLSYLMHAGASPSPTRKIDDRIKTTKAKPIETAKTLSNSGAAKSESVGLFG